MPRTTPPATGAPPGRRRPSRRPLRALGAGALLTLALGLLATPAYAHDELQSSNPADGATLAAPPAQVVLTFEEPPVDLGLQVVVTSPDGPVSDGSARIEGSTVVQPVQPSAPAGRYTVEWRVTSDDGHPVSGRFAFTAQAAAGSSSATPAASGAATAGATTAATTGATPAATPAPAGSGRQQPLIPSWAWIIGGVLVIALAIRINRRASAENKQRED